MVDPLKLWYFPGTGPGRSYPVSVGSEPYMYSSSGSGGIQLLAVIPADVSSKSDQGCTEFVSNRQLLGNRVATLSEMGCVCC
jgi:hypothetical protein